jgi:hypothetical protein
MMIIIVCSLCYLQSRLDSVPASVMTYKEPVSSFGTKFEKRNADKEDLTTVM